MTPLTALDIAGIRSMSDGDIHHHACPWCDAGAWSGRFHTQCMSPYCHIQVGDPLDILAGACSWNFQEAERVARKHLGDRAALLDGNRRKNERRVLDFWLRICSGERNMRSLGIENKLRKLGREPRIGYWSCAALTKDEIAELLVIARETGATMPDAWEVSPPAPCLAYVVQSTPQTIDRIALLRKGSSDVVWYNRTAGLTGLIGLRPGERRVMAANFLAAMELQGELQRSGQHAQLLAAFNDEWAEPEDSPWFFEGGHIITVVNDAADVVAHHALARFFPLLEKRMLATSRGSLAGIAPMRTCAWSDMRRNYMRSLIRPDDTEINAEMASLFERTGSRADDIAWLIDTFRREGRFEIVNDLQRLAENKVIRRDGKILVRETPEDYVADTHHGTHAITNFKLHVSRNILFRDAGETYCMASMRCGGATVDVAFPRPMLNTKASKLQEGLQAAVAAHGTGDGALLPTILDLGAFHRYVAPYINEQVASAPLSEGISGLGWSSDRKRFVLPGWSVELDATRDVDPVFYPKSFALRLFSSPGAWSDVVPAGLDPSCQDMIAMLAALSVRFYKRCLTRPLTVVQSSDSVRLIESLMLFTGQREIHDVGHNARDSGNIELLNGYPFFAAGTAAWPAERATTPYVMLSDSGYQCPTSPSPEQAQAAGRALQAALLQVAKWCLATHADAFQEAQDLDYHASLLREGAWIMREACGAATWQVSVGDRRALSSLLAQIPPAQTKLRMQLIDGEILALDASGLQYNMTEVQDDLRRFGTEVTADGETIVTKAAATLPAISRFYGCRPAVSVTSTESAHVT